MVNKIISASLICFFTVNSNSYLSGRTRPYNNIVQVDFDMLFFLLNLEVRYSSVRIIINSNYGRNPIETLSSFCNVSVCYGR